LELVKKNINICNRKHVMTTQIAVNEDLNLPDYMEDIERIVLEKGEYITEQIRPMTDKAIIKGRIKYRMIYCGGKKPSDLSSFCKETPVDEEIHIEGLNEHDQVIVNIKEEDIKLNIINSRKINVKAVITLELIVNEMICESIGTDIKGECRIQKLTDKCNAMEMCVQSNDVFRFYNQQALTQDKANIESVLYENITPRNMQLRCDDGSVAIDGNMHVFVLFQPEKQDMMAQWFEYDFPVQGKIECASSQRGMVGDLRWRLSNKEVEVKEDGESERRIITVSGTFDIGIDIYREEELERLEDVYAIDKKLHPISRMMFLPELLMKNNSICRLTKRMKPAEQDLSIMQVCNIEGDVVQELVTLDKNMIVAEGHVFVKMLYVTNDEVQPFRVATGAIPYSHNIELPGINEKCTYRINPLISSLTAGLDGNDEVEIHVQIDLDVIVFDCKEIRIIDDVSISDIPKDMIKEMPGMVGYLVNEEERLWDVAKKYHTTTDKLAEINRLSDDKLKNGQKLLIVKEVV